jgi:hypothetical protein
LLGFSAPLHAQNTISGTVTDSSNNPIIGVSIYVPELHKGTATDLRTLFLTNLPEFESYLNMWVIQIKSKQLRLSQPERFKCNARRNCF